MCKQNMQLTALQCRCSMYFDFFGENVLVYSVRAQQALVLVLVVEKITLTLIMTLEFTSQELSKEVQLQRMAGWCK